MGSDFEDKLKTFNEKSPKYRQSWLKLRALVNYSKTLNDFEEWKALEFVIHFFKKNQYRQIHIALLDDTLNLYQIDYRLWAFVTPWVKSRIAAFGDSNKNPEQLRFWFPDYEDVKESNRHKFPLYSNIERHKQIQLEAS